MPRDYDVQWAFSTKKQAAYGTVVADNDLDQNYPFKGPDILERNPDVVTDVDKIGDGHEWETQQITEYWDTKLKRSFGLTSFVAGWIAAYGLGSVSSALVSTSLAYQHTCKFSDPAVDAHQLPIASVVEKLSSGIKRKIRDLVVADFTISGEGKNRLQLEMNFTGSGFKETSTLSMPSLSLGTFLRMSALQFEIGVAASEVDVSTRLRKWSLKVNNNLLEDDGYYPGSGQYRGRCLYGKRSVEFNFTLEMDISALVELTHLENSQELQAIVTVQDALIEETYYHEMIITIPKLKYRLVPVGMENGKQIFNVECNVFYDSSLGGPLEIKVTNTQADYLV